MVENINLAVLFWVFLFVLFFKISLQVSSAKTLILVLNTKPGKVTIFFKGHDKMLGSQRGIVSLLCYKQYNVTENT